MVVIILDFGKTIELMVLVDFVLKMELIMKEFITKIWFKMGKWNTLMELVSKELLIKLLMIDSVMELSLLKMVINLEVNGKVVILYLVKFMIIQLF